MNVIYSMSVTLGHHCVSSSQCRASVTINGDDLYIVKASLDYTSLSSFVDGIIESNWSPLSKMAKKYSHNPDDFSVGELITSVMSFSEVIAHAIHDELQQNGKKDISLSPITDLVIVDITEDDSLDGNYPLLSAHCVLVHNEVPIRELDIKYEYDGSSEAKIAKKSESEISELIASSNKEEHGSLGFYMRLLRNPIEVLRVRLANEAHDLLLY